MSSLAAQQLKNPVLSFQWLRSLLWHRFGPWAKEFLHAMSVAKKKKKIIQLNFVGFFF